jgi:NAD(P)H-quinone oxidoreductase subunit 5
LLYFNPDRQPMKFPFPKVQDMLAQGFYIEKLYNNTIVWLIYQLSQLTAWVDRYVIEGLVNSVGVATIFGSEGLKYGTSGQVQSYFFTITIGAGALGLMVVWLFW